MANRKNLASGFIAVALADDDLELTLVTGQGTNMPDEPFYATLTSAGFLSTLDNTEIVLVTDKDGDVLTIERAKRGTTAKSFEVGDAVVNSVYKEDFDEIDSAIAGKANLSHTHPATDLTATGRTSANFLRGDNTWATPTNTTYSEITEAEIDAGTASTGKTITGRRTKYIIDKARLNVDADTVDTFHASQTAAANTIPVLGSGAKLPAGVVNTASIDNTAVSASKINFDTFITAPTISGLSDVTVGYFGPMKVLMGRQTGTYSGSAPTGSFTIPAGTFNNIYGGILTVGNPATYGEQMAMLTSTFPLANSSNATVAWQVRTSTPSPVSYSGRLHVMLWGA